MTDHCDNIKTQLEGMLGKGLSDKAKLVALLEACGISDREEVERLLECKPSTLRAARQALKFQRQDSGDARIPAPEIQRERQNSSDAPEIERQNSSASCARIVTPSGFLSTSEVEGKVPPSPPEAKPAAKRGTRLDRDWQLPDDWRVWARTNFPASTDASVSEQAAIFRDFWIAKPGAQACKLDWEATWRNWCRKGLSAAGMVRKPQYTGSFNSPQRQPGKQSMRDVIEAMKAAETAGVAA